MSENSDTWALSCSVSVARLWATMPFPAPWLVYPWLFVFTAGTLLSFFWMVAILGHRRRRALERVFFFVCLALCLFYGGTLLATNAALNFSQVPVPLALFAGTIASIGLVLLPALLLHLHVEYARVRDQLKRPLHRALWLAAAYVPLLYFGLAPLKLLRDSHALEFPVPSHALNGVFWIWSAIVLIVCALWQWAFGRTSAGAAEKRMHRAAGACMTITALISIWFAAEPPSSTGGGTTLIIVSGLAGGVVLASLLRGMNRTTFLRIDRQQNLLLAISVAFVALLYLSLIRRISQWLDPYLPPEATAALLLFLPVVFLEPLQRMFRGILHRVAHGEMDLAQRTMDPIQGVARLGDSAKLAAFIEKWVREQLQLASARLILGDKSGQARPPEAVAKGAVDEFVLRRGGDAFGVLRVESHGAMLSGETRAALELICEQFPAALDLCRLIEEKVRLERELAERERLAALGQMAASISHNLKNPLGAIKTILQLQLESPKLPEAMRAETAMVLEEINRLGAKLNQLLRFSRPAIVGADAVENCDLAAVLAEVTALLRPDVERRGIALEVKTDAAEVRVAAKREAVHDIVSNLASNAIEALPRGGHITLRCATSNGRARLEVQDDGPGLAEADRARIFQPFYTTKAEGTGLGLAIVARRVAESGGKIEWQSPAADGRGTCFSVSLPLWGNRQ